MARLATLLDLAEGSGVIQLVGALEGRVRDDCLYVQRGWLKSQNKQEFTITFILVGPSVKNMILSVLWKWD